MVEYRDAWGTVWRRLRGYTSGEVLHPAIPDWDAWRDYQFPPPPSDEYFEQLAAQVAERHPEQFVCASGGGFFQLMSHLRGPANFYMDLAEDHPGAHELADRMVEYNLHLITRAVRAGVDCIRFGDDWGGQDRLLIHPDAWRRFFKPRYARMFAAARDGGVHVWFHTDGWTLDILEDLVEIGVTVLNPQHACMGTHRVGKLIGGKVCIRTDIDRQWTIPWDPEQIVAAGRRRGLRQLQRGCILHGEVGQEVPREHRGAHSAFYRYGRYPLDWRAQ